MNVTIGTLEDHLNFMNFTEFSKELFALMDKYGYEFIGCSYCGNAHIKLKGVDDKPEIIGMRIDGDCGIKKTK